jgi:hypothetical protein
VSHVGEFPQHAGRFLDKIFITACFMGCPEHEFFLETHSQLDQMHPSDNSQLVSFSFFLKYYFI